MNKGKIKLKVGWPQRKRKWDRLAVAVEVNARHAARTWAATANREALLHVPQPPGIAPRTPWAKNSPSGYVRTGNLKRSIKKRRTGPKKWKVSVGAPYGVYVEYGTRYMIAQPFFRPAIKVANREFKENMKKVYGG